MSSDIVKEGQFLLYAVLLGIGIAFLYDCLRIFRKVFSHGIIWVSLEDLLYWIFAGIGIFYLFYRENNGAFRWFAILGVMAGMFAFRETLSPFLVRFTTAALIRIKRQLGRMVQLLTKPLCKAGHRTVNTAHRYGRFLRQSVRVLKKRLTVRCRMAKIMLDKRCKKVQRGSENG